MGPLTNNPKLLRELVNKALDCLEGQKVKGLLLEIDTGGSETERLAVGSLSEAQVRRIRRP